MESPGLKTPVDIPLTAELVALCERPMPKLGPEPGVAYLEDAEYEALAERLIEEAGGEMWIFAYGSLLWRPAFEVTESRRALAAGWRRDFCMQIARWRGSPEQPGLMMALRRGGQCNAIAQRMAPHGLRDQLVKLLHREIDTHEDITALRFIDVETHHGPLRALACWAEPTASRFFTNRTIDTQAHMLARACGSIGSGAAYLRNTLMALADHGIMDPYLHELAERVANEIAGHHGLAPA